MNIDHLEQIQLKIFCFPITLKCNLKCKLCGAHSPYYKNPYHPTTDELLQQADALFRIVSYIDKFDIGGGEPFLRTDLAYIMTYLRTRYRNQIGHLRIITNGTLMPPDDKKNGLSFIEEALKWNSDFFIIVDKYPVKLDKSEVIAKHLKKSGVMHELRDYTNDLHCGGWVDFGDLSLRQQDGCPEDIFHKCSVPKQGYFTSMVDGKLFLCGRARILYEKGIGKDYVDIMNCDTPKAIRQQQFLDMLQTSYLETCRYCNGMCEDSKRYLPAEQLNENIN